MLINETFINMLKKHVESLIAAHQCSFVPGRHSSDNIVIAQEVFHTMRTRKGKKGFVAMKVDLEKAYDCVRWEFLDATIQEIGLGNHFRRLIMVCASSVSMRVLFNGETTNVFSPTWGIRQGDPLSPYLFVLCVEKLAHCIQDKVAGGNWKPIVLSRGGLSLSHLFFADDLLLFGEANTDQMRVMSECLDRFYRASGQLVSVEKTCMLVSRNVNHNVASNLRDLSGFSLTSDLGKYLGVPLIHERTNRNTYNHLLERTQQHLST